MNEITSNINLQQNTTQPLPEPVVEKEQANTDQTKVIDNIGEGILNAPENAPQVPVKPLSGHFEDLKKTITDKLEGHEKFTLKRHENAVAKAAIVGARELAGGVLQMLAGVGTMVAIVPAIAFTVRDATTVPMIIADGAVKAWNFYSTGKETYENSQKHLLTKEQLETFENRKIILDKASDLFKLDKTGKSEFKEFLDENWPKKEGIPNDTYDIDLLGEFIQLFEKKIASHAETVKLEEKEKELEKKAKEKTLSGSNIVQIAKYDLITEQLRIANSQLKTHEAEREKIINKIVPDGKLSEEKLVKAQEVNKENQAKLKEELRETEENIDHYSNEIQKTEVEIEDLKSKIKTEEHLKRTKDNLNKLFGSDKYSGPIDAYKTELKNLENELQTFTEEFNKLKQEKHNIINNIEKNRMFLTQNFQALEKKDAAIISLKNTIQQLEKSKEGFLPTKDDTAIAATKLLKLKNNQLKAELALEERKKLENQTFSEIKKINKCLSYQAILDRYTNTMDEHLETIQKYDDAIKNLKNQEGYDQVELDQLNNLKQEYEEAHKTLKIIFNKLKKELAYLIILEEEIQNNKQEISSLKPQVDAENEIRLIINPHLQQIDKIKKDRFNAYESFLAKGFDSKEKIETSIQKLKDENSQLNPQNDKNKINENNKLIKELQANRDTIFNSKKDIEKLYDQMPLTSDDLDAELYALKNPPVNVKTDLRVSNPMLKNWQGKHIPNQSNVKVNPSRTNGNKYIFGTYNRRPDYRLYDQKNSINNQNTHEKELKELGRTNANNFLSNSYLKDIEIDGIKYKTVNHYLIQQRINKTMEDAFITKPVNKKLIKQLKELEELISEKESAYEVNEVYEKNSIPEMRVYNLDSELKKALFYKFVGPNGRPNEEGRKLLATGNVKLYAGNELGDPSNGMQFIENGYMSGENKLGICLMDLREMLREEEKTRNYHAWMNKKT